MSQHLRPIPAPLYDPRFEHDACGVGFVADLHGAHRGRLVGLALDALAALEHRGARAADDLTGDGAGIALQLTPRFVRRIAAEAGARGLDPRRAAIGMCFLPQDHAARAAAERLIATRLADEGLQLAGWRDVPLGIDLSNRAVGGVPVVRQAVVARPAAMRPIAFRRALAIARRAIEHEVAATPPLEETAIASLSSESVVYKGLFIGRELGVFYSDLGSGDLDPAWVSFHQRYSTNTFPSWRLAQPFRFLAHNGEINTVRGNREQMRGRRKALGNAAWVRRLVDAGPIVSPDGSDSLSLDEACELLLLAGRRIDAAMLELLPPAAAMEPDGAQAAGSSAIEPWDGPSAVVFGDGPLVGALLDRNGLRPAAYSIGRDGLVVCSSEAGCLPLDAGNVTRRGRLGPGELLLVDTDNATVLENAAAKRHVPARSLPRPESLADRPVHAIGPADPSDQRLRLALGLDAEVVRMIVRPMATTAHQAIWSMGDDLPLPSMAKRPRRVSAFLRQAFAQVTNPAIDPERERIVMSMTVDVGRRPALLGRSAGDARLVRVELPVVDADDWHALVGAAPDWRVARLDATFPAKQGATGLRRALDRLARQALAASARGAHLLVISDRRAGERRCAVPSLLATGRVQQALLGVGRRPRTDIAVEAGDAFDVHDLAMLFATGASVVHPWLLLELASEVAGSRGFEELSAPAARHNLLDALDAALHKVLARMGVSTMAAYHGGQLFDVLGLRAEVRDACFSAAPLWPGSVGFDELGSALVERHRTAFGAPAAKLVDPGLNRYRADGEPHTFAPRSVKAIQALATGEGVDTSEGIDAALATYRQILQRATPALPRDLLEVRPAGEPVALASVEPATSLTRRFVSSAMSLGALSPEAHRALAIGMARLGASANTGEGGEDRAWYAPLPNGDRRDAAIKQVASARFGVTAEYLSRAEQLEIKISQGSKPGEGGQLPGKKVSAYIAGLRRGQPGMTMISPPPHHDIYSIEDLAQLINDLRAINPRARIGVKLVAGAGIGTIAAGVAKAHADYIMVSGHSGGTGASPLASIKHAGLPWELGLAEVHQVLVRSRLRDRVVLRVDGGLQTGRDLLVAALLGAEEFGFGSAALVAIGCDMARQCHLDTCPTGIATQREDLRAKFRGRPEDIVAYFTAIAEDLRRELASIGLANLADAVGRTDLLRAVSTDDGRVPLELGALTAAPSWSVPAGRGNTPPRDVATAARPASSELDERILADALARTEAGQPVSVAAAITTRERAIGARLAGELSRRPEPRSLPHVSYELAGAAGQSLGAFAIPGMRIVVRGEANDYVAKGLSGGTVVVRPADLGVGSATLVDGDQAIAGNTCLYGATSGRLHLIGRAGMRFAVRNSGAQAVVEGIGAHGCEYMTGGAVVVIGSIGRNFGAGMTGGRAYLYDADGGAARQLNGHGLRHRPLGEVALELPAAERELRELLAAHAGEGSKRAEAILAGWAVERQRFLVVEPIPETQTESGADEEAVSPPLASAGR
jgi:glutamate synthase domain-containing protein 2/glutamate synthase domain-containing protein 1/glutamate synthase domain-containing protein 3